MPVHINEVVSNVRTLDDTALLSPQVLREIVQAVMQQVRLESDHRNRLQRELSINTGIAPRDREW